MRATQYIPDIVQLQQFLHDKFNHRLYNSEAASKTFKDIVKKLRGIYYFDITFKFHFMNIVLKMHYFICFVWFGVCVYRTSEVKNSFAV